MLLPQAIPNAEIRHSQLFINGQFVKSAGGKTLSTFDPATGRKIADVPDACRTDLDRAVVAARLAFRAGSPWRKMDASERGALLHRLANLVEQDIAYLASVETLDSGKPYQFAVADVRSAVRMLRYYAGLADKIHGRTIPADGEHFSYTRYEPIGVCGLILSWNFPLLLACGKLAAALAAGCTVIVKPSEKTPLSTLYLANLTRTAGFPDGVVNVLTGSAEMGRLISYHMDIDKVSFTGSTETGKLILQAAGRSNCKRVSLEMSGRSPLIVTEEADVDKAVEVAHLGSMYNAGQCYEAASRLFVHEAIYERFCKRTAELAGRRKLGSPFDCPDQGPQIGPDHVARILDLIESGKKEGARLLCGGQRAAGPSDLFVEPTVFADVTDDMRIAREEILGPVQQILKYRTLDEVIERANSSAYGLAAGIFSSNINTVQRFAQEVVAGTIWVNTYLGRAAHVPAGGVKLSGLGRERGIEGILPYCEVKTVTMKMPVKNA